jgi:hypothetical protein
VNGKQRLRIINETKRERPSFAGVPSWMLVLMNKMEDSGRGNLFEIWPNLEVYFHGGVNFEPYREQYKKKYSLKVLNTIEYTMPPKVFLPSGPQ